jgi:hypothetical protein
MALWRTSVLAGRWTAVLLLRWVALARWRAAVALRRAAVLLTLGRTTVALGRTIRLLIFGVIRRIDGTEEQFHDPKIWGEVDRRVGAGHLVLLVLEVCHRQYRGF